MRIKLAAMMVLMTVLAASGASTIDPAKALLTTAFHLTTAEVERLDGGEVISRTLDVKNRREIATLGIVRIKTLPSIYVERLADIATFKRTDDVMQVGRFSNPPQAQDIASLTIDEAELKRIRDCRLEDCEVRLGADGIERLRRDIDWRQPDAGPQARRLVLQLLVDYVGGYGQRGTAATMEYADSEQRVNVGREFASLLAADTLTSTYAPRLRQHMLDYPTSSERITDFIYWSKELVRSRPVISITHVSTAAMDNSPIAYAIASKQIYAMHYYDASLGLTLLLPDRAAASPSTYVVYLNRSRIDLFDGAFGGVTRRIVAGRARTVVANQLQRLQHTLAPPSSQEAATHVR